MIDIGVNLGNTQLRNRIPELLCSAKNAGLTHIIVTGTDIQTSREAIQLCREYNHQNKQNPSLPALVCTAGVHPHDASSWNDQVAQEIEQLLLLPEVVATGETGLDFNRNYSTPAEQISAFRAQIELACISQKPLFLHERDAFKEQISLLSEYQSRRPNAVIHCFTGNRVALDIYLEMGFYIGITGWVCDERRGKELADIVRHIPLDRLMIETDSPYLLPRNIEKHIELDNNKTKKSRKSRTNEPAHLIWIVKKLAECYQINESEIIESTTSNSKYFFNL